MKRNSMRKMTASNGMPTGGRVGAKMKSGTTALTTARARTTATSGGVPKKRTSGTPRRAAAMGRTRHGEDVARRGPQAAPPEDTT